MLDRDAALAPLDHDHESDDGDGEGGEEEHLEQAELVRANQLEELSESAVDLVAVFGRAFTLTLALPFLPLVPNSFLSLPVFLLSSFLSAPPTD